MAAVQSRAQIPIGSAQWVLDELHQADHFVRQEVEEFTFSARNEMEWLNEHMAEVFCRTEFDVVEAFKTPGKLRGKTPKTARRRNHLESRAPLTDVFTATPPAVCSPAPKTQFYKLVAQFQVAEDSGDHEIITNTESRFSSALGKENTDSGYHGMTEDEYEIDQNTSNLPTSFPPKINLEVVQSHRQDPAKSDLRQATLRPRKDSEESFVSAQEIPGNKITVDVHEQAGKPTEPAQQADGDLTEEDVDMNAIASVQLHPAPGIHETRYSHPYSVSAEMESALDVALEAAESPIRTQLAGDADHSTSEHSSPTKSFLRKKSSLTFASLPAREPLTTNKSLGTRVSGISHSDQWKSQPIARETHFGKNSDSDISAEVQADNLVRNNRIRDNNDGENNALSVGSFSNTEELPLANSTQILHEKLAMLGKSNPARLSKSTLSTVVTGHGIAQDVPLKTAPVNTAETSCSIPVENKTDWIVPITVVQPSNYQDPTPVLDQIEKRHEPTVEDHNTTSPKKDEISRNDNDDKVLMQQTEDMSCHSNGLDKDLTNSRHSGETFPPASYPVLKAQIPSSTTPAGSPSIKKSAEGPLSASKSKLYSVLKSARGIFASSAGVSAQAKVEAQSPHAPARSRAQKLAPPQDEVLSRFEKPSIKTRALQHDFPNVSLYASPIKSTNAQMHGLPSNLTLQIEDKDTQQASQPTLDNADEKRTERTMTRKDEESLSGARKPATHLQIMNAEDMPPPPPPKSSSLLPQSQKPTRPLRATKNTASNSRIAPVAIRVTSESQKMTRVACSNVVQGPLMHDTPSAVVPQVQLLLPKKDSKSSLATSSTQSFKTSVTSTSTKLKALDAAARKKEQDEKEVQRKAVWKRELERKRAAKVEEEKRIANEQKAAEQRALELKNASHNQAAEQRKADAMRRNEQLRVEVAASQRARDELIERSHAPAVLQRGDTSVPKPLSRIISAQENGRPPVPHINPAKPVKRFYQLDAEDDYAISNSQHPPKRRITSDEADDQVLTRPRMAPPIRLSNMRKMQDSSSKVNYGGMSTNQAVPSMLKSTVTAQHHLQHAQYPKTPHINDLASFSTARIPFADAPNPPHLAPQRASDQPNDSKTPATAHKSSPQYPNGDSIDLPEIATDSDDDDSDEDQPPNFQPPDWANSPALRELLSQQQLVDPMKVFGPIGPLMMDEVFKGNSKNKERFRARTSSANWNGPDRLTEEERRRDREARERMEKEGGWSFQSRV